MNSACRLPEDVPFRPSIANGYLGTVIHAKEVYMAGLYNGLTTHAHRAVIPSTVSHRVTHTEPQVDLNRSYQLNVGEGI